MTSTRLLVSTCVAAIALGAATPVLAGDLAGYVIDQSGTVALQSAQVRVVEAGRVVSTGRDGGYVIPGLPAGTYTVEVRYVGAQTVTRTVDVPETGTARLDLSLGGANNEILVYGLAANQASALSRKREADGVTDVLTRDAVGQFPDQNVAESLRRLPGVNILDDQGEGRFVSVRGLDPELNAASLNGVRVPAPESDVRSVALDVISSDLIESIEVKKSLTPDMDGDTIGASIEINTVSAFDRKKDLLSVKLEGSYNDKTDSLSPKGSLDFSTKLSDNFGIAGGISYYKRRFATDNMEMDGWDEEDGVAYADTMEYRDYDVTRERISSSLSFDFRLDDTTTLYARGLYSQFDDQEYRRRLTFEMDEAPSSGDATHAAFDAADGEISVQRDLKDRFESQKIRSIVVGGDTDTGDWKLSYSGSWAKSTERESGSFDPFGFERKFEDEDFGVSFDYSDPRRTYYTITAGEAAFLNPSEYEFDKLERTTLSDSQDEEYALKLDIGRTIPAAGGDFTVQAGGKARWRTKSYNADIDVFESGITMADGDLLGTQDYAITDISPVLAKGAARDFFYANQGLFELDEGDTFASSNESDYSVDENIFAGYLLGRWDSETLRVIGGARIEHTENTIRGNLLNLDDETVTLLTYKRSYTDWLPSLNVRFEPSPGLVLRAGGYKSLVRPKLSKLAPRVVIEDDEGEFGNPDLKPYEAWNADLSLEYYFGKNAAITAGFFYKDIKNYAVDQVIEDYVYGDLVLDEATLPINGDSATVKGFEFSYSQALDFLPSPLDGFLVQANYTYTDASGTVLTDGDISDPRNIPLPASSKNTFNIVIGYEKGPISLRAAGTYRDKYLDEIGDEAEEDRYVDSHFQIDLSGKYNISKNIQLFAEWINVNNAKYFAYQNFASRQRLLQYEEYGPTIKFGAKVSF